MRARIECGVVDLFNIFIISVLSMAMLSRMVFYFVLLCFAVLCFVSAVLFFSFVCLFAPFARGDDGVVKHAYSDQCAYAKIANRCDCLSEYRCFFAGCGRYYFYLPFLF